jgi:dUTP pyrophosphatase
MRVKFRALREGVKIPQYQTSGSVGFDLASIEDLTIEKGKTALIPTGLAFELPHGFEMQVRPRSGLALKHSITVLNSPGTIDSDYRGEIKVILINHGDEDFKISVGDRVAQAVITKVELVDFEEVHELSESERGSNGFGSTGKQ